MIELNERHKGILFREYVAHQDGRTLETFSITLKEICALRGQTLKPFFFVISNMNISECESCEYMVAAIIGDIIWYHSICNNEITREASTHVCTSYIGPI